MHRSTTPQPSDERTERVEIRGAIEHRLGASAENVGQGTSVGVGLQMVVAPEERTEKGLRWMRQALDRFAAELNVEVIRAGLIDQYRALRLLDDRGEWALPVIGRYSDRLLPLDLDAAKIAAFVDEMAGVASRSRYLNRFFEAAARSDFPALRAKFEQEGARVIPDVLLHGQMLERLTGVLVRDAQVNQLCLEHWMTFRAAPRFCEPHRSVEESKSKGEDLYSLWNLGLLPVAGDWPYYAVRLALPELNRLDSKPSDYRRRRAIAHHLSMVDNAMHTTHGHRRTMDWSDPNLREIWIQVQRQVDPY